LHIKIFHKEAFNFFPLLLWWVGVHCGIYTCSYVLSSISYMNPPPLPFSFIPLYPNSWSSFNSYHFCIYLHVYSFLHCIHPPTPFPHHLPNTQRPTFSHWAGLLHPPVLWFCRIKKRKDKTKKNDILAVWDKVSYTGSFLVIFPCIYVFNHNWFISSNFLHSTLVPFLW
jgi:hypothetical protein